MEKIESRSYQQILDDMVKTFQLAIGNREEIPPGSMLYSLFTIMADQLVVLQQQQIQMMDWVFQPENLAVPQFQEFEDDEIRLHVAIAANVCECGKEKHGFASHSDWCKKYTPNM